MQALYFDRYQKLLAPGSDPLRDTRLRDYLNSEMGGPTALIESTPNPAAASAAVVDTVATVVDTVAAVIDTAASVEGDGAAGDEPPFRLSSL
jgi:hypothetical protein